MKTQMTITIPTGAGKAVYFTIEFLKSNFDAVCEAVGMIKKPEQVYNNQLWEVK